MFIGHPTITKGVRGGAGWGGGFRGPDPPAPTKATCGKRRDSFVTIHACDKQTDRLTRRTDRGTEFSSLYRVCITCSAVKMCRLSASLTASERLHCNWYTIAR